MDQLDVGGRIVALPLPDVIDDARVRSDVALIGGCRAGGRRGLRGDDKEHGDGGEDCNGHRQGDGTLYPAKPRGREAGEDREGRHAGVSGANCPENAASVSTRA